jgi:nucleotide-binding universal stress UspA family protein
MALGASTKGAGDMFRKIVVGLEGSEASWCAVRRALSLSHDYGGEDCVVSVEEHLPRYAATIDEVQDEQEFERRCQVERDVLRRSAAQRARPGRSSRR